MTKTKEYRTVGHPEQNGIQVFVSHNSKKVTLVVWPAELNGDSVITLTFSTERMIIEDMPRLNRKRLETLQDICFKSIESQTGQAWDFIASVLPKFGMTGMMSVPE